MLILVVNITHLEILVNKTSVLNSSFPFHFNYLCTLILIVNNFWENKCQL